MSDNLETVKHLIKEHRIIRGHVKLAGDSVPDQEALITLKSARSDWTTDLKEMLSEQQKKLQQAINFLDEGLTNHFAEEEEALPALLGGFLMQSLLVEHQEIRRVLDDTKLVVASTNLAGLSQEELMAKGSEIQQAVNSLRSLIEEHADKEEVLLEILQRVLADRG